MSKNEIEIKDSNQCMPIILTGNTSQWYFSPERKGSNKYLLWKKETISFHVKLQMVNLARNERQDTEIIEKSNNKTIFNLGNQNKIQLESQLKE